MYGIAIGGWTLSVYFLQYLLENIKVIIIDYHQYVLGYIAVSGIISFAICYRLGPLTNPRSKKLIQWSLQVYTWHLLNNFCGTVKKWYISLQAVGLLAIFYSSYMYELTYPIDLLLVTSRITPFSLFVSAAKFLLVILSAILFTYKVFIDTETV